MPVLEVSTGASVIINPADFKSAMALKGSIAGELAAGNLKLDGLTKGDLDVQNLMNLDMSVIEPLLQTLFSIDSSEKVNDAIFACLTKCLYNGEKITEATFDNVEAREDYYLIVFECLKVNLTPFFKGLVSKLNLPLKAINQDSPK